VNPKTFYFSVIVPQRDASLVFAGEIRSEEVRLFGQGHITLPVVAHRIIPAEQQTLPSAALGWLSGGEVALASDDSTGVAAREPFFEVRATVAAASDAALLHGRAGRIRFVLSPEPLLHQWNRRFRQLLQKHYGL
jgi:putative peptide zinc metalloprotease protein